MQHFPLVDSSDFSTRIEFSHISLDQKKGAWKNDSNIVLDHIKINVFVGGDFSFFVDGMSLHPVCGDICVLPPYKMHHGQILKPTHTDYFQIDMGIHSLDMIPGGKKLVDDLVEKNSLNSFSHPKAQTGNVIIELCSCTEREIAVGNYAGAFGYLVELLSKINEAASSNDSVSKTPLSGITLGAVREIEDKFDTKISLLQLSEQLKISPSYLSRLFKAEVGVGVHEYLMQYRIMTASKLLKEHSVTETAFMCGFCDTSHFIASFKERLGMTPKEYKKSSQKGEML